MTLVVVLRTAEVSDIYAKTTELASVINGTYRMPKISDVLEVLVLSLFETTWYIYCTVILQE